MESLFDDSTTIELETEITNEIKIHENDLVSQVFTLAEQIETSANTNHELIADSAVEMMEIQNNEYVEKYDLLNKQIQELTIQNESLQQQLSQTETNNNHSSEFKFEQLLKEKQYYENKYELINKEYLNLQMTFDTYKTTSSPNKSNITSRINELEESLALAQSRMSEYVLENTQLKTKLSIYEKPEKQTYDQLMHEMDGLNDTVQQLKQTIKEAEDGKNKHTSPILTKPFFYNIFL
jgi:hypothetical protein